MSLWKFAEVLTTVRGSSEVLVEISGSALSGWAKVKSLWLAVTVSELTKKVSGLVASGLKISGYPPLHIKVHPDIID